MTWETEDLTAIGMEADAVRARLHPEGRVTYCTSEETGTVEVTFRSGGDWMAQIDDIRRSSSLAVAVKADTTLMAVDYLRLVALCRLHLGVPNVEVDWRTVGLKVAQLALRFGANDFGQVAKMRNEPNTAVTEEEVRRVIRDAGFVPRKRLAHYGALAAF